PLSFIERRRGDNYPDMEGERQKVTKKRVVAAGHQFHGDSGSNGFGRLRWWSAVPTCYAM
ncbi:hypothetical protein, partial [Cupriavidus numazuensis]|uniref:hypothetical protein n=1 Tax=Cupriavidus numazuensis TaxID=221992 RepID=UPI001BA84729